MTITPIETVRNPYRLIHDVYVLLDFGDTLVLSEFDLSSTQFRVLSLLDPEKGRRLTTLSNRVMRSKSQVTRIVDKLEERGLISRLGDPQDRRAQRVRLTKEGHSLRDTVSEKLRQSLRQRFDGLEKHEQEALAEYLDKLRVGMIAYHKLD